MDELPFHSKQMSVLRNYRFRLYPTHEQAVRLQTPLDASRWLYNYFLNHTNLSSCSKEDMQFALTELKEQETWLRNYHSKMLQMVIHKIDSSKKALRMLRRNGHKIGKLQFIKYEDYNSFIYNQSGFKIERHGNTDLLWLSKIGYVEIRLHRTIKIKNIKQITICKHANNKWYAVICCEVQKPIFRFVNVMKKSVGIDVGITKFAYDSNNHIIDNPQHLTKMLKPLRRASRRLSRTQKGSKNRQKAKTRLQILHERIGNKRNDFLHKISYHYSQKYDVIFLEKLQTLNMVKNRHLSQQILDSGWGTFKQFLKYKAKTVVEVNPYNTSVNCSKCGNRVSKTLATRTHRCDRCGLVIDRDYNASKNILKVGLQNLLLPREPGKVTPVEILLFESMKQEEKKPPN